MANHLASTGVNTTQELSVTTPDLHVIDGKVTTTSQQISEHFGKRHRDVLRAVRSMECSPDFRLRNFALSSYRNEQGKDQPCFHITRDGFTFLAMGFTGKEAAQWKEAYLETFNRMEAELTKQAALPTTITAAQCQHLRELVRALLNGSKTQTRRAVKTQPCILGEEFAGPRKSDGFSRAYLMHRAFDRESMASVCPYGQTGDRLWVKETTLKVEDHGYLGPVYAESDEGHAALDGGLGPEDDYADVEAHEIKKRPSIFMPRSMSRITLEVTGVRVERLQDISEADAISEGCAKNHNGYYWGGPHPESGLKQLATAVGAYRDLWESINGPGSWDANPWVWAIEFKRVTP